MKHTLILTQSAAFALGILLVLPGTIASARGGDSPNVILLMGDDHGWDETGYNGHPYLKTPVLDEMAASGLRLDRFYSAHPTCSPTRGSVITGRHPNRYGTFAPNWSIRPEEVSIAQILSKAGYSCGHFGKWHLGPVRADSPTNPGAMGFDDWLSHDNFFELHPWLSRRGEMPKQFRGESSEILVENAIRFIESAHDHQQPFFVVVWFGSPHEPYSGVDNDLALYDDLPEALHQRTVRLTSNETGAPVERPLADVLQERYAEITAMDRSIGRLRTWLSGRNLRDNTLLWYCGDNGTSGDGIVTSPFRGQKATMYEGGIRVPGIIEWPARISSPVVSDVSAVTSDILPTLCDVTDQPLPDRPLDGISLKPLIEGSMTKRPGPICFWSFDDGRESRGQPWIDPDLQQGTTPLVKLMDGRPTRSFRNLHHPEIDERDFNGARAILHDGYKLVVGNSAGRDAGLELFDLKSDPSEKSNVIKSHPEIAADLQQQLRDWQQSVLTSLTGADYH
ncbi:MAG: sulfatase-like hydrolase/transferase [Planctomycetaceae bacterium]